jgi:adenosylmethionine-8-amino-7-oxononanoate aminotransferase
MPLAAVLATQAIYDSFLDDSRERAFLHSHSYSGNPLACAAALATLDIFDSDDVLARNAVTAGKLVAHGRHIAQHPKIADFRHTGMILAFELMADPATRTPFPAEDRIGLRIYRAALRHGLVLRPLGDVLYWMPPYCITGDDIAHLATATQAAIQEVLPCA